MKLVVLSLSTSLLAICAGAQVVDPMGTPPKSKAPLSMMLGEPRSLKVNQAYGITSVVVDIRVPERDENGREARKQATLLTEGLFARGRMV